MYPFTRESSFFDYEKKVENYLVSHEFLQYQENVTAEKAAWQRIMVYNSNLPQKCIYTEGKALLRHFISCWWLLDFEKVSQQLKAAKESLILESTLARGQEKQDKQGKSLMANSSISKHRFPNAPLLHRGNRKYK